MKNKVKTNKINIAELLINCPKGMELDCTMFDGVKFDCVDYSHSRLFPIQLKRNDGGRILVTEYGQYADADSAKCIIFPKDKTTWEGFVPPCRFKVGDRVKHKSAHTSGIVVKISNKGYHIDYPKGEGLCYVNFTLEKDYELAPNKFDINTLVLFESKVLVRDYDIQIWIPTFWGKYLEDDSDDSKYLTTNGCYKYCIPYEGNEHLLGTTKDCDEFYKTWK